MTEGLTTYWVIIGKGLCEFSVGYKIFVLYIHTIEHADNIVTHVLLLVSSSTDSEVMDYLASCNLNSSSHLEKILDWNNKGVEKDLIEIAKHLTEWEEKLVSPLGLTHTEKKDIKVKYAREPELQR